ncbi:MAG TPA: class I SAM-dependent methyltransferase [Elusimicrobiales bacterium]|nr:class I SAM-dependent methyltransferase [Elusimicrobiales bacterium]
MDEECCANYDRIAGWFDAQRGKDLMESSYLEAMLARLPAGGDVLDLGCGSGEPLAGFFIRRGFRVTGLDGSPEMIAMCRARFPEMSWAVADMRGAALGRRFDAVLAWDSFFHLSKEDQRAMFAVFAAHLKKGGLLLFTSGPAEGESSGIMEGCKFHYSSLSPEEYRGLLAAHGLEVLRHKAEDPACGKHTVWLAQAS